MSVKLVKAEADLVEFLSILVWQEQVIWEIIVDEIVNDVPEELLGFVSEHRDGQMFEHTSLGSYHSLDLVVNLKGREELYLDMSVSLSSISSKGLTGATMGDFELWDGYVVTAENTLG